MPRSSAVVALLAAVVGCAAEAEPDPQDGRAAPSNGSEDYCAVPEFDLEVLVERPPVDGDPIDDVNWFARPVPHEGDDWIIAFASHEQNYLYNLSTGRRVRIPDRSDAVATPDGRYMTVPSTYTPDSNIRFYPVAPMLEALEEGRDATNVEPAFIHDHESMHGVYYQSTALLSDAAVTGQTETRYRLMFSGGADESNFRIVDYLFRHDAMSDELIGVEASEPMAICPEVQNDLNTPFISKDGRYVASYTSDVPGNAYSAGASLKVFEITGTSPSEGTTTCTQVTDFGFAAGKADFSFDGSMLAFHLSQGSYLTPFINGGLPETTITDVMVARLDQDPSGRIVGHSAVQRLSTSLEAGVGSYFPAFFPDGKLFFLSNEVPREADAEKRFRFRVVDPSARGWRTKTPTSAETAALWRRLGELWQDACKTDLPALGTTPFPLQEHELPLQAMSLTVPQCEALVHDARGAAPPAGSTTSSVDWDALGALCRAVEP